MAETSALGPIAPGLQGSAYDQLSEEHNRLRIEHDALQAAHNALIQEHTALQERLGLVKKEYVYGEDECQPIAAVLGNVCPTCGWEYGGKAAKDREPHSVL